jgi:hypothetical protein
MPPADIQTCSLAIKRNLKTAGKRMEASAIRQSALPQLLATVILSPPIGKQAFGPS